MPKKYVMVDGEVEDRTRLETDRVTLYVKYEEPVLGRQNLVLNLRWAHKRLPLIGAKLQITLEE